MLADQSFYRVFNLAGSYRKIITSYYYHSIGGYHPAKLRVYQDLIERKLSTEQNDLIRALQSGATNLATVKTPALDMLNAKYIIYKEGAETKAKWNNENALGNCWFVNEIRFVKDANEEMKALDSLNPKQTAVVQKNSDHRFPLCHSRIVWLKFSW
jgi:hypothetical protein